MDTINYKISDNLLTILSKFHDLNGKINGVFFTLGDSLQNDIKVYARKIDAFSAVSNDIGILERLHQNLEIELIDKLLTSEEKTSFEKYLHIINNFDNFFNLNKNIFTKDQLLEIHQLLLPHGEKGIRAESKVISSVTIEDGIRYEYSSEVRTQPQAIQKKLDFYIRWLNSSPQIDPAIFAAITYFKIAEIHPFLEANGRTSKIFSRAILYQNKIDELIILPIYDYFLENQHYYFDLIEQTISTGDLTKWIEFYCKGLLHSAIQTSRLISIITGGSIDIQKNIYILLSEREHRVLSIIKKRKNASGAEIGRELNVTRQNINKILRGLLEKGIIKKIGNNTGVRYIIN